jgi:hypothetical protein
VGSVVVVGAGEVSMANPYRMTTVRMSPPVDVLDIVRTPADRATLVVPPRPRPPIRQLPPPEILLPFRRA